MSSRTVLPRWTLVAAVAVLAMIAVMLVGCGDGTGSASTLEPTSTQGTAAAQPAETVVAEASCCDSERAIQTAPKGMELYSWQTETGEWRYSILFGTNSRASLAEVQKSPMSLDETKMAIAKLAVGEVLVWANDSLVDPSSGEPVLLPIPPHEVVEELRQYASERQVDLYAPGD